MASNGNGAGKKPSDVEYTEEERAFIARYNAALHGVQTGVKVDQEACDSDCGSPKHLRVGVNATKVDQAALVAVLINNGVIKRADYLKALAVTMEGEKVRYEARLSKKLGKDIKLG